MHTHTPLADGPGKPTVAGDSAFGYDVVLRTVYQLGAKRVIDLRAHSTDQDKALWPIRLLPCTPSASFVLPTQYLAQTINPTLAPFSPLYTLHCFENPRVSE